MKRTKKRLLSLMLGLTAICTAFGLTACDSPEPKENMFGHVYDKEVVTDKYLKSKATCTQKAVYYISCECGAVGEETFEYGETVPHEYHGVVTNPTCTEQGYTTYTCDCGESYVSDYVNAKGHNYHKEVITDTYLKTQATCTKRAVYYKSCECGAVGQATFEYGNYLAHTYNKQVVTDKYLKSKATCMQKAVYYISCKCGAVGEETFEYGEKASSHTYTAKITRPTCTEQGYTTYTCDCGESYVSDYVNANGHTFADEICTVCGKENADLIDSVGLRYTLLPDGNSYSVTGIGTCQDAELVIPATYNNLPVTTIGKGAFSSCKNLTSVFIPDSITTIGEGAFSRCDNLTSIEVAGKNNLYKDIDGILYSKDGKTLIQYAIGKTKKSFTIPNGVTTIEDDAFEYCNLTSIVIPNSVTTIGSSVFAYCDGLTNVVIPDSVTTIGSSVFAYCNGLTNVVIPDSVTTIGGYVFAECYNLTSIEVAEDNTAYKDIDGNLYSKDGTTLIQYAIGKTATSFTMPNTVTVIGDYAFYSCKNLTNIGLPNSVTTIGNSALENCQNLISLIIPDSVTTIEDEAFYKCSKLTSVDIGNSVTTIGFRVFNHCAKLTSIVIPDSVTAIENEAFAYCDNLTNVSIGNSVTTIGNSAFYRCSSLTDIVIPDSVITMGNSAFNNCTSLTNVTIGDGVTTIGDRIFYGCGMLTTLTIGNSISTIGDNAFRNCTTLKDIQFTGSVEEWNAISKGTNWNYKVPATKVVCLDGEVEL